MRHLLTDPSGFFVSDRDTWHGGALAVLGLCGLSLASLLVPVAILVGTGRDLGVAESFPAVEYVAGEARLALDGRSLGVVSVVTLAPLPLLAGYAAVFHLLSWPVATAGSIVDTARVTAWGAIPLALANALTLVGTLLTLPTEFGDLSYAYVTLTARTIVQRSEPSVLLLATNLVGLACVCWAAVVWTRGLAHVRGCSSRRAALAVGLPVAVAAGLNAANTLYGFL